MLENFRANVLESPNVTKCQDLEIVLQKVKYLGLYSGYNYKLWICYDQNEEVSITSLFLFIGY